MNRLRLLIVGGGHLGKIHARLARSIPDVDVVGVVDTDPSTCAAVEELLGVPTGNDLSTWLDHIDGAIVATPTACHLDIALRLISHQIPTLVEKPLATTSAEARILTQAAIARNTILQVGHVERFNAAVRSVPRSIVPGRRYRAIRLAPFSFRSTDINVVMDLMIHDIDLILSWHHAPVARVDSWGLSVVTDHIDLAHAEIEFDDGAVATLYASRVSPRVERTMEIVSRHGILQLDLATGQAESVLPGERYQGLGDLEQAKGSLWSRYLPRATYQNTDVNPLRDEICNFTESIRGSASPVVDGRQGTAAVELAERIASVMQQVAYGGEPQPSPLARPRQAA